MGESSLHGKQDLGDSATHSGGSIRSDGSFDHASIKEIQILISSRRKMKLVQTIVFLGFLAFMITDSVTNKYLAILLDGVLKWIGQKPLTGGFTLTGIYFLATILFLPGAILTLIIGYIFAILYGLGFGIILSTVTVFIGGACAAITSFHLARYLFKPCIVKCLKRYKIFRAIHHAIEINSLHVMLLFQLSSSIQFNLLNCIWGTTSITVFPLICSILGFLPRVIIYSYLGCTAGCLAGSVILIQNYVTRIVLLGIGIFVALLSAVLTSLFAKRHLMRMLLIRKESNIKCKLSLNKSGISEESESIAQSTKNAEVTKLDSNKFRMDMIAIYGYNEDTDVEAVLMETRDDTPSKSQLHMTYSSELD